MLRRVKSDVLKSLPEKIETILTIGMPLQQKDLYQNLLQRDTEALSGVVTEKRRLLNIAMQLRKAANHPYLFDGVEDRSLDPYGDHLITNSGNTISERAKLRLIEKITISACRENDSS